ncbi:MAG: hypothetical protein R3C10_23925 [Pirellulales bacterium]
MSSPTSPGNDGGGGGGGRVLVAQSIYTLGDPIPLVVSVAGGNVYLPPGQIPYAATGEAGIAELRPDLTIMGSGHVRQLGEDATFSEAASDGWTLKTDGLQVDAGALAFSTQAINSSHDLILNGGHVTAVAGWIMNGKATISGFGTMSAALSGGAANFINASGGTLVLGDANSAGGFDFGGATTIASGATLNLLDLDGATLQLGGTLTASGNASLAGGFHNLGTVNGPNAPGEYLTFTDDVDGTGNYTGSTLFSDGFSPGNSAAVVSMENVTFDATAALRMEIGGLAPGTKYDQLNVSGTATLAGTLNIFVDPLFTPQPGNEFLILSYASRSGEFDAVLGAGLIGSDVFLTPIYDANALRLVALSPGDGNGDGWVDGLDYLLWAGAYGTHPGPDGDIGDGDYNDDGWVDGLDYLMWAGNYGSHTAMAVPEPAALTTVLVALLTVNVLSGRKQKPWLLENLDAQSTLRFRN